MRVFIEIFGDKMVERKLMQLGERALTPEPAFEAIGRFLTEIEAEQFDGQGIFSGGWEPLAGTTIDTKVSKGQDPRILHATLRLRESLTIQGNPDMIMEVAPTFLRFGTKVPYGAFHHTGTMNMPERRPVDLTEWHRRFMIKMLQGYVLGKWVKSP